MTSACGDDGPCPQAGEDGGCIADGETGTDPQPLCVSDPDFTVGSAFTCQGEGTGWLVTDVYGAGKANPITSCLVYNDPLNIPEHPTAADCASVALDLIPHDIPTPTACCDEAAPEASIIGTCEVDCGYTACKAAVAAIRASADALVAPNPALQDAFDTSKSDLHAYANTLEAPATMQWCATQVSLAPGQVVPVGLGSGASNKAALGHIKDATLFLSCDLDPDEPYVANPEAGECTASPNTPQPMAEQQASGTISAGAITLAGPRIDTRVAIRGASVSTGEVLNRDMSVDFTLLTFDADIPDMTVGSLAIRDAHIRLAAPASGRLLGDTVTFAPGMLRIIVTADVMFDGIPLFDGLPIIAEISNDLPTTAMRAIDGSFHFVDATFIVGEHTGVLATEPSVLTPIQ